MGCGVCMGFGDPRGCDDATPWVAATTWPLRPSGIRLFHGLRRPRRQPSGSSRAAAAVGLPGPPVSHRQAPQHVGLLRRACNAAAARSARAHLGPGALEPHREGADAL